MHHLLGLCDIYIEEQACPNHKGLQKGETKQPGNMNSGYHRNQSRQITGMEINKEKIVFLNYSIDRTCQLGSSSKLKLDHQKEKGATSEKK